jgi:hypothetical protein
LHHKSSISDQKGNIKEAATINVHVDAIQGWTTSMQS